MEITCVEHVAKAEKCSVTPRQSKVNGEAVSEVLIAVTDYTTYRSSALIIIITRPSLSEQHSLPDYR